MDVSDIVPTLQSIGMRPTISMQTTIHEQLELLADADGRVTVEQAIATIRGAEQDRERAASTRLLFHDWVLCLSHLTVEALSKDQHAHLFGSNRRPVAMLRHLIHEVLDPGFEAMFGVTMVRPSAAAGRDGPPGAGADEDVDESLEVMLNNIWAHYTHLQFAMAPRPMDADLFELFVRDSRLCRDLIAHEGSDAVEKVYQEHATNGHLDVAAFRDAVEALLRANFLRMQRVAGEHRPAAWTLPLGPNTSTTPQALARKGALSQLHTLFVRYQLPARQGTAEQQLTLHVRRSVPMAVAKRQLEEEAQRTGTAMLPPHRHALALSREAARLMIGTPHERGGRSRGHSAAAALVTGGQGSSVRRLPVSPMGTPSSMSGTPPHQQTLWNERAPPPATGIVDMGLDPVELDKEARSGGASDSPSSSSAGRRSASPTQHTPRPPGSTKKPKKRVGAAVCCCDDVQELIAVVEVCVCCTGRGHAVVTTQEAITLRGPNTRRGAN